MHINRILADVVASQGLGVESSFDRTRTNSINVHSSVIRKTELLLRADFAIFEAILQQRNLLLEHCLSLRSISLQLSDPQVVRIL